MPPRTWFGFSAKKRITRPRKERAGDLRRFPRHPWHATDFKSYTSRRLSHQLCRLAMPKTADVIYVAIDDYPNGIEHQAGAPRTQDDLHGDPGARTAVRPAALLVTNIVCNRAGA